jgi:hypothetical protein
MPEHAAAEPAAADWTCTRCEVTVSWMAEVERPELPATWSREDGGLYCLVCRREMAGEAGLEAAPEDATASERQKLESQARIEFEIKRKPDRQDNRIANSCHTSVVAVRKARARLGLQSRISD